jgi:tRNA-dihydrouridine synthase B
LPAPSSVERLALAQRHLELLIQFKSEKIAIQEMRKHAAWYIKGLRDAARIREQIMSTKTFTEMSGVLEQYKLTL